MAPNPPFCNKFIQLITKFRFTSYIKPDNGLERLLSSQKHMLPLENTQVWFPALMLRNSQVPETPAAGDWSPQALAGSDTHRHTPTQRQTNIYKIQHFAKIL